MEVGEADPSVLGGDGDGIALLHPFSLFDRALDVNILSDGAISMFDVKDVG